MLNVMYVTHNQPKANTIKRADMLGFNPDFVHSFLRSAVTCSTEMHISTPTKSSGFQSWSV